LNEYYKARQLFLQTLKADEALPIATKAILMNNVAYANLVLDDPALLSEADHFSDDNRS
jgi:hypothetical protein